MLMTDNFIYTGNELMAELFADWECFADDEELFKDWANISMIDPHKTYIVTSELVILEESEMTPAELLRRERERHLQERIEALETEFNAKIKALKAEVQQVDEFPQDWDEYWYMDINGDAVSEKWHGVDIEKNMFEIGNFFKTKEQAEFAAEKLKVEAELRKFSRPFENRKFNYYIFFYVDGDYIEVSYKTSCHSQGTIYFESEVKAQQAIDAVGEERIKKYIFGVEVTE